MLLLKPYVYRLKNAKPYELLHSISILLSVHQHLSPISFSKHSFIHSIIHPPTHCQHHTTIRAAYIIIIKSLDEFLCYF